MTLKRSKSQLYSVEPNGIPSFQWLKPIPPSTMIRQNELTPLDGWVLMAHSKDKGNKCFLHGTKMKTHLFRWLEAKLPWNVLTRTCLVKQSRGSELRSSFKENFHWLTHPCSQLYDKPECFCYSAWVKKLCRVWANSEQASRSVFMLKNETVLMKSVQSGQCLNCGVTLSRRVHHLSVPWNQLKVKSMPASSSTSSWLAS